MFYKVTLVQDLVAFLNELKLGKRNKRDMNSNQDTLKWYMYRERDQTTNHDHRVVWICMHCLRTELVKNGDEQQWDLSGGVARACSERKKGILILILSPETSLARGKSWRHLRAHTMAKSKIGKRYSRLENHLRKWVLV